MAHVHVPLPLDDAFSFVRRYEREVWEWNVSDLTPARLRCTDPIASCAPVEAELIAATDGTDVTFYSDDPDIARDQTRELDRFVHQVLV